MCIYIYIHMYIYTYISVSVRQTLTVINLNNMPYGFRSCTNWHAHLDVCLNTGTAKWSFRNDTISFMLVVSTMISYI